MLNGNWRTRAASLAALLAIFSLSACAPSTTTATGTGYLWHGAIFARAVPKPEFALTDQNGQPYDFATQTRGKLALVYFGYTHCPDACPATMATLTLALRKLATPLQNKVAVIFVTTDPKPWLANFDPGFVGLTGTNLGLIQAQLAVKLPLASADPADASGNYFVEHSALVMAFSPDNLAHIGFPEGVSASDEASDFQQLLTKKWQS